ncbi:MAG: DUF1127 domain-containing protein [Paracoccaceae bacterium]
MSLDFTHQRFEPASRGHGPVQGRDQDPDQGMGHLRRFFGGIVRHWQRRRMIRALQAMDDRLLRDIGLARGDIEAVVDSFDDRELQMVPLAPAALAVGASHQARGKAA